MIRQTTVRTKFNETTSYLCIMEFQKLRFRHTLTVLVNVSAIVDLCRMVLGFCHIFLRFPISFPAMSLFQTGSSDRMKLFTECAMISQILACRLFASRFPFSNEEGYSVMMVGTQQSTVSLGSLGPFLRTCRRSRCFGRKVHNCETWSYLPHFASFHSIRKP